MKAQILSIGDELLIGQTTNTNATWLGEHLSLLGVQVDRIVTVPDDASAIHTELDRAYARAPLVLTTGGLGPTHDDVTMDGVAAAFGRELERNDEAAAWLAERGYSADDLAAETTHLPADCRPLANEAGVAPGAVVESVYVLPGVPTEMKAMFESIADEFEGTPTHTVTVDVDEPESALLERFTALQEEFDVSVGSYPGESVRVKITASSAAEAERAAEWVRERSTLVESR